MAEPTLRGGQWWAQRDDGTWVRHDEDSGRWVDAPEEPPPRDETRSVATLPEEPRAELAMAPSDVVERRARPTTVLLWINVVLGAVAVVSDVAERNLIMSFFDGENVTLSDLAASDDRQALFGALQGLLVLTTAVFFVRWFSEAYRNVNRYGATGLPFSEGWAVGGWFVPIANFFIPKRIANAIHKGSDPELEVPIGDAWKRGSVPAIYQLWWGAWVISGLLGLAAQAALAEAPTPDDVLDATALRVTADMSATAAAGFAVLVVRSATQRQIERHRSTLVKML